MYKMSAEDRELWKNFKKSLEIECPVCLKAVDEAPINQCNNGHILCSECKPKMRQCPVCRDYLYSVRNLFAEKYLDSLPAPCPHQNLGCEALFMKPEVDSHELTCDFRPVTCPTCDKNNIPAREFLDHLADEHKIARRSGEKLSEAVIKFYSMSNDVKSDNGESSSDESSESENDENHTNLTQDREWPPYHLTWEDKDFFLQCSRIDQLYHFFVYGLSPSQISRQFTFTLALFKEDKKVTFTDNVVPIDELDRETLEKSSLIIPFGFLEQFVRENGEEANEGLDFSLEIQPRLLRA